jgi:hypothetical protein
MKAVMQRLVDGLLKQRSDATLNMNMIPWNENHRRDCMLENIKSLDKAIVEVSKEMSKMNG